VAVSGAVITDPERVQHLHPPKRLRWCLLRFVVGECEFFAPHPDTPTETVTEPPLITVAMRLLTNLANALDTTSAVVVDAVLVVTGLPRAKKLTPSKLPSRTTLPAVTPALVVTLMQAVLLTARPSRTAPAPSAETDDRETAGAIPCV
jgi:hypothetical protein